MIAITAHLRADPGREAAIEKALRAQEPGRPSVVVARTEKKGR